MRSGKRQKKYGTYPLLLFLCWFDQLSTEQGFIPQDRISKPQGRASKRRCSFIMPMSMPNTALAERTAQGGGAGVGSQHAPAHSPLAARSPLMWLWRKISPVALCATTATAHYPLRSALC